MLSLQASSTSQSMKRGVYICISFFLWGVSGTAMIDVMTLHYNTGVFLGFYLFIAYSGFC
jgi:hypothetical protein